MARTPSKTPGSSAPLPKRVLSPEEIDRALGRLEKRTNELQAFDVATVPKGASPELSALSTRIRDTLDRCFGEGTAVFRRFEEATDLNPNFSMYTSSYPQQQHYQEWAAKNIAASIALLEEAKSTLREDRTDLVYGDR